MTYLIAIGVFQSLLAVGWLLMGAGKRVADYLLVWLLICIATHLGIKFIIFTSNGIGPIQQGLNTFIQLSYGPILWLFVKKVQDEKFRPYQFWYLFFPTVLAAICYLSIVIEIVLSNLVPFTLIAWYNGIMSALLVCSLGGFGIASFMAAKKLPIVRQLEEKVLANRLSYVFLLLAAVVLCALLFSVLLPPPFIWQPVVFRAAVYLLLLLASFLILQYKMRVHQLPGSALPPKFDPPDRPEKNAQTTEDDVTLALPPFHLLEIDALEEHCTKSLKAEKKKLLCTAQHDDILGVINAGLEKFRWYTDSDFSLEGLSKAVAIPKHHITEALNHRAGISFTQWLNDRRLIHFTHALEKCSKQGITPNILVLAFDAGFNSKSGFNNCFKRRFGITPSAYFRQLKAAAV